MKKEMICIVCPRGCHLTYEDGLVSGNACVRGKDYATNEIICPKRMVTSTVKIISKNVVRLPVITSEEIDKNIIKDVMKEINKVVVKAPIHMHDTIIKNVLGSNVDIIATREILE